MPLPIPQAHARTEMARIHKQDNAMKPIRLAFFTLFIGLTLVWLLANGFDTSNYSDFWPLRKEMVRYSGILAIAAMSVAVFLAARPVRMEPVLRGLDKSYRLHKWLGIAALVLSVLHWSWAQIPKWLVGYGWLERPERHAATLQSGLLGWLHEQRGLAENIGEWAFYLALVLIVLALIKRLPYRWFFRTHRWLALVYLVLVVHGAVLFPPEWWPSILGATMGLLLIAGSVAACVSLLRRIGRKRQVIGRIDALTYHHDNQVLRVEVMLDGPWPGHKTGQFAFVTFDAQEGPHPFSLSSAWRNDGKLAFSIKGLGDYTRTLPDALKQGDLVMVEGPYGCFDFRGRKAGQIWVAGGIGIAPFIGRLQALAHNVQRRDIVLIYCTSAPDHAFIERIRALAARARIRLHVQVSSEDGRLTPERLRQLTPDWKTRDIWFCGPAGFGNELRDDLTERGLAAADFHQELFNMR